MVCPHVRNRIIAVQTAVDVIPIVMPCFHILCVVAHPLFVLVGEVVDEVLRVAADKVIGFQSAGIGGDGLSGHSLSHLPHPHFLHLVRHRHEHFILKEVVVEVPQFGEVCVGIEAQLCDTQVSPS